FAIKADGNELLTNFRFFVDVNNGARTAGPTIKHAITDAEFQFAHPAALLVAAAVTSVGLRTTTSIAVFWMTSRRHARLHSALLLKPHRIAPNRLPEPS